MNRHPDPFIRIMRAVAWTQVIAATLMLLANAAQADYTARHGDQMATNDVYAYRTLTTPGTYEFSFQVSVNDSAGIFKDTDTRLRCWLEVDGVREVYLGATTVGEWANYSASENHTQVGNLAGTVRLYAEDHVMLTCRTGYVWGVTVETARLYKTRLR